MSLIDEVVKINISRETASIDSVDLNTLLIIGDAKKLINGWPRVKSYSSLTEVAADYTDTTLAEYKNAATYFAQDPKPLKLLIGQIKGIIEKPVEAYQAIVLVNNNFYGVIITSSDKDEIVAVSGAVEADNKLFSYSSGSDDTLVGNDITVNALQGSKRTILTYNKESSAVAKAAVFGMGLTKDSGSATWAYKGLNTIKTDSLTTAQRDALKAKNTNYYVSMGGVSVFLNGVTASGEYIDNIIGIDWLTFTLRTRIANALANTAKIPFTNAGIGVIESILRNTLQDAVTRDILDESSIKVTVPDIRDISSDYRASRTLPDVNFSARLAGAIHKIIINGTITV